MTSRSSRSVAPFRFGGISVIAAYLVIVAEFSQALFSPIQPEHRLWALGLRVAYLILFTVMMRLRSPRFGLLHSYFAVQSAIAALALWLDPELGAATALFVLLAFQSALTFTGNSLWAWTGLFAVSLAGPLIFHFGALEGLARALMPIAGSFVVAAYIVINRETESARNESQAILNDLESLHEQLHKYAAEAEDLAIMNERNRIARDLHDSVSQVLFSIALNARSARILLERKPSQARRQLEELQRLTQVALAEMRGQITQLRLKGD